ncbi:MAG: hypothetical protein GF392_03785 [Candidatus Omnitrophica bacterium]|nr:hypothetical protein [Candidatus Omnitrophota bacterium]
MKKATAIMMTLVLMGVAVTLTAAEAVEVYTFKKDRVDQDLSSGNRGYLSGKPKDIPEKKRNLKRTLIGVDIEVPGIVDTDEPEKEESAPAKSRPERLDKGGRPVKTDEPVTVVSDSEEEQWIK